MSIIGMMSGSAYRIGKWLVVGVIAVLGVALIAAVLFRTTIATAAIRQYLAQQGTQSDITIDSIGFSGLTAHGSLDMADGTAVSFAELQVGFEPHRWLPSVQTVRVLQPIVTLDLRSGRVKPKPTGNFSAGEIAIAVVQAKVIALTDAGRIEIAGDARLIGTKPVAVNAVLRPAKLRSGLLTAEITGGRLTANAMATGIRLHLAIAGNAQAGTSVALRDGRIAVDVPDLSWTGASTASAAAADLSVTADDWSMRTRFSAIRVDFSGGRLQSSGEAVLNATGALSSDQAQSLLARLPILSGDRRLAADYQNVLRTLAADVRFTWRMEGDQTELRLAGPAELRGHDAVFRVSSGVVQRDASAMLGSAAIDYRGPGVPQFAAAVTSFSLQPGGQLEASVNLDARLSLASFRDLRVTAAGKLQGGGGLLELNLDRCAGLRLGSYEAKRASLLRDAAATVCPANGAPLYSASRVGWTFQGHVQDASATLQSASVKLSRGGADLFVTGTTAVPESGSIKVSAGLTDAAATRRFGPTRIAGDVVIAGAVAQAKLGVAMGPRATPIGRIAATYRLASGQGTAALDFSDIAFTSGGLQPAQISPLLATLAQAEGRARFAGQVAWSAKGITSSGQLDVDGLHFSSPLGAAQKLTTHLVFNSLLPLTTAPNQRVAIERVDWVVPLTNTETQVSLTPTAIIVTKTETDIAGGEVSITPFAVRFKPGSVMHGVVKLSHVDLGRLIAASNLGEKLRLSGAISGSLPFSFGPEGFRITGGRIDADGPGRLSISPSLWGNGATNAVEKAAYGALENLSYQSLSATVESVPGGRLRTVFHVVGYDDSPNKPPSEFKLADLLTGKAFQEEIPIPRGTGVNLTLDTSLNFDELLRGYQNAWSQVRAMTGAP